jgi:ribosomal protein S18 acetylase RimI-like enzyme
MNIEIRLFQPSEQDAAKKLVLEGFSERFNLFRPELHPDLDDIQNNLDIFLVAYLNDKLVATGGLTFVTDDTAKIVRMSTAKAFRGQGIAGKVLRDLETVAKTKGIQYLTLVTGQTWTDAIRFYEHHGFQIVGLYRDDTDFQGVRLEKKLS